jgi:ribosomal protein L25 (general stress protein Ctc)
MSLVRRCALLAAPVSTSLRSLAAITVIAALAAGAAPQVARAQNGYVAAIAYSQSTGKIGHTVRQARTEDAAKSLAIRACKEPDAKVFMWAQDQWVAIATAEGLTGAAGFGRGRTADEAQQKALAECQKRAHGAPCRVELCVHSAGSRARQLRKVAGDPQLVAARQAGYVAAIAYSPKTGKIGSTAGAARTKKEAHELALKACDAPDAKVFMWGPEWVAIATVDGRPGVAGFAPGATREIAERAALEQAEKLSRVGKCQVALAIHAAGDPKAKPAADAEEKSTASTVSTTAPAKP